MVPLSPVRKGTLLSLMRPELPLFCGTPLSMGRLAPLGFAKGTWALSAGLVTMPVTARAEGFEPPEDVVHEKGEDVSICFRWHGSHWAG